jgi:hypothetical protein
MNAATSEIFLSDYGYPTCIIHSLQIQIYCCKPTSKYVLPSKNVCPCNSLNIHHICKIFQKNFVGLSVICHLFYITFQNPYYDMALRNIITNWHLIVKYKQGLQ